MKWPWQKEKIIIEERLVCPTTDFKEGDKVIVHFLTETKIGKVIGKPFTEWSVFNGSIKEFIPVEFTDGNVDACWSNITHKL